MDPEAARLCHEAGPGSTITLPLGHKLDPRWGQPITVTGCVVRCLDGRFRYTGGIWGGVEADMGPCAVLRVGHVDVLIMTYSTYDWKDEQLICAGLDPRAVKFVVVKNPMNYRYGYGDIARAVFVLDTPGPTPATLRHVAFKNLQRPYYPADTEIPSLSAEILRSDA